MKRLWLRGYSLLWLQNKLCWPELVSVSEYPSGECGHVNPQNRHGDRGEDCYTSAALNPSWVRQQNPTYPPINEPQSFIFSQLYTDCFLCLECPALHNLSSWWTSSRLKSNVICSVKSSAPPPKGVKCLFPCQMFIPLNTAHTWLGCL